MARRRWIADAWSGGEARLRGTQAQHLARVLRAQAGQRYEVVADGRVWLAAITSAGFDEVVFQLEEEVAADAALPVSVLLAVWKFDRMEWAIEKLTELGVATMAPVIARRTEKHLAQAAATRVERWRRIAREAAQQSRRVDTPEISDPVTLKAALEPGLSGVRLLLAEEERIVMLRDALPAEEDAPVSLAVGPEGGWTPDEVASFITAGWQPVSLGPRILRAETAAIAATAIAAASMLR